MPILCTEPVVKIFVICDDRDDEMMVDNNGDYDYDDY